MKLRPFVSWVITWSFLVMTWTGIVLFIVPKGRVANWIEWELMGLSKDDYAALHVTFMVLFVVGVIVHIVLNWKLLVHYLKNCQRDAGTGPKILISSFLISLVVAWGTLAGVAPFSSFLDWQEEIKASWEDPKTQAPYGHAELSTLDALASKMGWDKDSAIAALKEAGFTLTSPHATVDELAKENDTTPQAIFDALSKKLQTTQDSNQAVASKGGYGKLSLIEAAKKEGFDVQKAIEFLHVKGIEATPDSPLKPIAQSLGVGPSELVEMLKGQP